MTKDEALKEFEEVKKKLRDPKSSLFVTIKLYRRYDELWKIIDAEEQDNNDDQLQQPTA